MRCEPYQSSAARPAGTPRAGFRYRGRDAARCRRAGRKTCAAPRAAAGVVMDHDRAADRHFRRLALAASPGATRGCEPNGNTRYTRGSAGAAAGDRWIGKARVYCDQRYARATCETDRVRNSNHDRCRCAGHARCLSHACRRCIGAGGCARARGDTGCHRADRVTCITRVTASADYRADDCYAAGACRYVSAAGEILTTCSSVQCGESG